MISTIKFKLLIMVLFIVLFVMPNPGLPGTEIDGVVFKDHVIVEDTRLSIRGIGLYRHLGFIKAYVGALYIEDGEPTEHVLSDKAKRLEIEYFHSIKGDDFGPVTSKLIARNVDPETLARLQDRIEKHNALYEDVQPGDRYSLTYIPGKGTELALNGKPIGVIEGDDFASAIYAIWLGQKPMNRSFKQQLLGIQ